MLLASKWKSCNALMALSHQYHIKLSQTLFQNLKSRVGLVNFSTSCLRTSPVVPELTSVRYPNLSRGLYSELTAADISFFKGLLTNTSQVLTADDGLDAYNTDWMRIFKGF
jgi:hypothetical protein